MSSISVKGIVNRIILSWFLVFIGLIILALGAIISLFLLIPTVIIFEINNQMQRYYGGSKNTKFIGPFAISPRNIVLLGFIVFYFIIGTILGISDPFIAIVSYIGSLLMLFGSIFYMTTWAKMHKNGYYEIESSSWQHGPMITTRHSLKPRERTAYAGLRDAFVVESSTLFIALLAIADLSLVGLYAMTYGPSIPFANPLAILFAGMACLYSGLWFFTCKGIQRPTISIKRYLWLLLFLTISFLLSSISGWLLLNLMIVFDPSSFFIAYLAVGATIIILGLTTASDWVFLIGWYLHTRTKNRV